MWLWAQPTTAAPAPPMPEGKPWSEADNTPQRILSLAPTTGREPFFEIDENKSDFLNPEFLAECVPVQNLNADSDHSVSNVPNQGDSKGYHMID